LYLAVIEVIPLDNYKLLITFENAEKKVFDLSPYLDKGIFREFNNKQVFNTVRVSFDTVEWDNHADIDPEVLYEDSCAYE
jgi:hypothetical protein